MKKLTNLSDITSLLYEQVEAIRNVNDPTDEKQLLELKKAKAMAYTCGSLSDVLRLQLDAKIAIAKHGTTGDDIGSFLEISNGSQKFDSDSFEEL